MLAEKDEYIQKAYKRLEKMSADEQKRWEYEMRQKVIRDHRHMLASGKREGLQEGLREGRCQGEHKKAVEIAQKMFPLLREVIKNNCQKMSNNNIVHFLTFLSIEKLYFPIVFLRIAC